MNRFETRRRVPYSARQMYDLIVDVEAYPHYLPLVEALRVRTRETIGGREVLTADMSAGYKAIRETFRTRVTLMPEQHRVDVTYLDGPFSSLENRWRFHDLPGGGSEIEFYIAYAFRSRMLEMLVGALFDKAFRRFAEAFEARAHAVYGRSSSAPLVADAVIPRPVE